MSFKIYKSDGSLLTEIANQTVNNAASSLALAGKGASVYGLAFATNFVRLLENFYSNAAPANPIEGQLWCDAALKDLKVWNGNDWISVGEGYYTNFIRPALDNILTTVSDLESKSSGQESNLDKLSKSIYGVVPEDFNYDLVLDLLGKMKTYADALGIVGDLGDTGRASANALRLSWKYDTNRFNFEMWDTGYYSWMDLDQVSILSAVAGDDTVDVSDTSKFSIGKDYVVVDSQGNWVEDITVLSILSVNRIRLTTNINTSVLANSGYKIGRRSMLLDTYGFATFKHNDTYFTKSLDALEKSADGILTINRRAAGTGTFTVSYRLTGTQIWFNADLLRSATRFADDTRDEDFYLPITGNIDLRIRYKGLSTTDKDTVKFIALYTAPKVTGRDQILRPTNVTPANQSINVGQTPTLQGSEYLHLYGKAQRGAQFRIATDSSMNNIVLNSSSDNLASWVSVASVSDTITDAVSIATRKFLFCGQNGAILASNDGTTLSAQTSNTTKSLNAIDTFGSKAIAVGVDGTIIYNNNFGIGSWTVATAGGSFVGIFNSVSVIADNAVAVGINGTIQRSSNGGVIWTPVTQAANFLGVFNDVTLTSLGKGIAVGSNGTIHTTPDAGATWVARSAAGAFTGNFQAVAVNEAGYAVAVGDNSQIQTSDDFGATWTQRTAPAGATGVTFNEVSCSGDYFLIVGSGGKILSSSNRGVTFVVRTPAGGATNAFLACAIDPENNAFIAGAAVAQRTLNISGTASTSYTVPNGFLSTNSVYFWDVQYSDGVYSSDRSVPTAFATSTVFEYVNQPQNVAPAANATQVSIIPRLQSSAFSYYGAADTHNGSQWQVSRSADFSSPVLDSGITTTGLTDYHIPEGTPLTSLLTYFWRVRHRGARNGFGPWSVPTSFTAQSKPETPSILIPEANASNVSITPTITITPFTIQGSGQHVKSQYQVSLISSFSSIAYDSGASNDLITHKVPSGRLTFGTVYYVRARQQDVSGSWSDWSFVTSFKIIDEIKVQDVFSSTNYQGNGQSGRAVTTGINIKDFGGFHINKNMNYPSSMTMNDSVRVNQYTLQLASTGTFLDSTDLLNTFTSTGFTTGPSIYFNASGYGYNGWSFRRARGFSDVTRFVADGANSITVDHSLGMKPGMIISKFGSRDNNWIVHHKSLGVGKYLSLNNTEAVFLDSGNNFIRSEPTDKSITYGTTLNNGNNSVLSYIFADDESEYGLVRCGSYVGNGTAGVKLTLGWQPQFILIKSYDARTNWALCDISKQSDFLYHPNLYSQEYNSGIHFERLSDGVRLISGHVDINRAGYNYVYMAIRKAP